MVGVSGMGPDKVELNGKARTQAKKDEEQEKVGKRFEEIGLQLMNRASGDFQHDAIASVLGDPTKRRLAAQIIGQAYVQRLQPRPPEPGRRSRRSRTRSSPGASSTATSSSTCSTRPSSRSRSST